MKSYKIIADTREMSRQEWMNVRIKSIGGSEVAAVCGVSRWKSPLQIWCEKVGVVKQNSEPTEAMKWGIILEPVIRKEFAKRSGLKIEEAHCIFSHYQYSYITANIDGYVRCPDGSYAVLEIKTSNAFSAEDWNDGCPVEYFLQVQYYLGILGLKKAFLVVLIGGVDFRQMEIERDDSIVKFIFGQVHKFWKYVEEKKPPKSTSQDNILLSKIFPRSDESARVVLGADAKKWLEQYEIAKADMEKAKKLKEEAEAYIKAEMKDCEAGSCGEYKITWKSSSRTSFNIDKAKTFLNNEQIKACMIENTVRILRVSKAKKKEK